jgi:hypothetical protein
VHAAALLLAGSAVAATVEAYVETSSPQLLTYWLGYEDVMGLYEDVRRTRGAAFRTRAFVDEMMALGPVPVRHYRERMLGGRERGSSPCRAAFPFSVRLAEPERLESHARRD